MFKRFMQSLAIFSLTMLMMPTCAGPDQKIDIVQAKTIETVVEMPEYSSSPQVLEIKEIEKPRFTNVEIDLMALVTMAEAEGEPEYGKRLVIDTILNRVDSEHFPDTIKEVIYQPHQFTSMHNGRVDRCYVDDNIRKLVLEEIDKRTNGEVMFFHANRYGKYGKPMLQVENHYFSSY